MVPEISHRCPSCGVAVRDGDALFCPECGTPLKENSTEAKDAPADPRTTNDAPIEKSEAKDAVSPPPGAVEAAPASHPHSIGGKTRETLHRATAVASAAARGVIEEPVKRVEKIRTASSHVIEEASYDASLRFVLVALGLFLVFLVLLVLSKVMG